MEVKEMGWRRGRNRLAKKKSEGAREWGKTLESFKTLKDGGV
jgi:hypothetical protein